MSEEQPTPVKPPKRDNHIAGKSQSSVLNRLTWIVIGFLLMLVAVWTVWAARQTDVRSLWAPDQ